MWVILFVCFFCIVSKRLLRYYVEQCINCLSKQVFTMRCATSGSFFFSLKRIDDDWPITPCRSRPNRNSRPLASRRYEERLSVFFFFFSSKKSFLLLPLPASIKATYVIQLHNQPVGLQVMPKKTKKEKKKKISFGVIVTVVVRSVTRQLLRTRAYQDNDWLRV